MPLIAELVTKLAAKTEEFDKNIDQSVDKLFDFGNTVKNIALATATAIGTVAVTGFIKLLNVVNETEERVSHLVDTASTFGTTVAGLQRLDFIGGLSGVGLGQIQGGLKALVNSLKDLQSGGDAATESFKKLGLAQDDIANLSLDETYLLVIERLKGVTNSTEQAKLASEIFGRTWTSQINIIKSDIVGLSDEFDSFGGALTDEQAEAIDNYGDSVSKLSAVFDVFKLQLTAAVAGPLEMVVNWIKETTLATGGLAPLANTVAQGFVTGIQIMVGAVQTLIDVLQGLELKLLQVISTYTHLARIGTLGLSSITGEKLLGIDLDLIDSRIEDLKKRNAEVGITAPLQSGLNNAQTLLQQQQQKLEVKISTEKGLKAEIAESPEVTAYINKLIEKNAEIAN